MEELKRFQGSTFDTISMKKLVEDQDTILELTTKIQELQNEVNCMNDSRDFKDAESSTQCTIPRSQSTSVFPILSRSWRNAKPFSGNAEPQRWAAKHCFTAKRMTKFVPETRRVPGVTKHLVHRRDTSSCSWVTSTFQQRSCERFRCRTRQQTAPPSVVRDVGAGGFSVPTSPCVVPNTARKFAFLQTQFRAPVLLPSPSVPQSHSIGCVWRSISMVCRHQCRVQSQLHSSKEGQTFCNHLEPARIRVPLRDVQVSHHDVGGHPGPAFATNLGDSTLHGITSPAEHPHLAACCSVMAKDVKRTATRTETAGEGQRQTEAAQQQHPERL